MWKKVFLFICIALLALTFWGCANKGSKDVPASKTTSGTEEKLEPKQQLAVNFLFALIKNYGKVPCDIQLHDIKVYSENDKWYYISVDAKIEGINNGERRLYGNQVGFFIDEKISFTNKQASAYKFMTEDNKAVGKGEKLDTQVILQALEEELDAYEKLEKGK